MQLHPITMDHLPRFFFEQNGIIHEESTEGIITVACDEDIYLNLDSRLHFSAKTNFILKIPPTIN